MASHLLNSSQTQKEVIAFLSDPRNYPTQPSSVETIETHGAIIFMAGDEVWKIKRNIKLPYMDFSTLAKRYVVCCREVDLNRQTAPSLYLGLAPIGRRRDGSLNLAGEGEPVEWAVRMRRFDQDALLSSIAAHGKLNDRIIWNLASHIAGYHKNVRHAVDTDFASTMIRIARELIEAFQLKPQIFSLGYQTTFAERLLKATEKSADLLRQRSRDGFVRRCHGDLHLGNIVLLEGSPVLFDALEFDEGFATTDVLYDIAFLIMDLWHRNFRHEANLLLNRYLVSSAPAENLVALSAMPLFLAVRAGIRAMVMSERAELQDGRARDQSVGEATAYFVASFYHLSPAAPRLVAIGGLSGTGKSTLGARIAHLIGASPGAIHLRSDVERKLLHGVEETRKLPDDAYSKITTQRVYESLRHKTLQALTAGRAVIVDAVFADEKERRAIESVAREAGCRFQGFWLSAPSDLLFSRVAGRKGDASDADATVIVKQLGQEKSQVSWELIDARGTPQAVQDRAEAFLATTETSIG